MQDSGSEESDADADDAPTVTPLPLGVKANPSVAPTDDEQLPPSYVEAVDGATLLPRVRAPAHSQARPPGSSALTAPRARQGKESV